MIDITPIINSLFALAAAIATAFLIPWIKSKTTEAQRDNIIALVKIAVAAAEQLCNAGKVGDKKQYVIDYLASKNLKIDANELDKLIEAAVLEINKGAL